MGIAVGSIFRWLVIPYSPCPDAQGFLGRGGHAAARRCGGPRSGAGHRGESKVLRCPDGQARHPAGLGSHRQPVRRPYRLQFVALDPNHFSPLEAAALNHYSGGKRLLGFGLLAWLFSAAADPAADQAPGRSSRQQEDGCVLPGARLSHASDSTRWGTGWFCVHQPVGREQGRSRPTAWPGRLSGLRVLAARRRAPRRLPAARVR